MIVLLLLNPIVLHAYLAPTPNLALPLDSNSLRMDLDMHSPYLNAMVKALVRIFAITCLNPPTVKQVLWLVIAVLVTTAA